MALQTSKKSAERVVRVGARLDVEYSGGIVRVEWLEAGVRPPAGEALLYHGVRDSHRGWDGDVLLRLTTMRSQGWTW